MIEPELREYYQTYIDLFGHPGWKQLMEDLDGWIMTLKESAFNGNEDSFHILKGKYAAFLEIRAFEERTQNIYEELDAPL